MRRLFTAPGRGLAGPLHRKRLKLWLPLLVCVAAIPPTRAGAQDPTLAAVLQKALKARGDSRTAFQVVRGISDYLDVVADARRDGRAVPPPPSDLLDLRQSAILSVASLRWYQNLALPAIPPSGVAAADPTSSDAYTRRRALATLTREWTAIDADYHTVARATRYLSDLHDQEVELRDALKRLIDVCARLQPAAGVPGMSGVLTSVCGQSLLDLLNAYTASALLAPVKLDELRPALAARRDELRSAYGNILTLLGSEQTDLEAFQARRDSLVRALAAANDSLAAAEKDTLRLAGQITADRRDLDATAGRQSVLGAQLRASGGYHARLIDQRAQLQRAYDVPFEQSQYRCPNGNSYDNCSHENLKAAYRNAKADLGRRISQVSNEIGRVGNQMRDLSRQQDALARHRTELDAAIAAAERQLTRQRGEMRSRIEPLRAAMASALSGPIFRAGLYAEENAADRAMVERMVRQLSE